MATEKRFKIIDKHFISYYGGDGHLISNGNCKFWLWHNESGSQKVCDKLNIIMEENEQLQKRIQELEIGENEIILKQETTINQLIKENEQLKEKWKEQRHEDINELSVIVMKYKALENENEKLKTQSDNKQKHIVHLENKIHRMRENIKRLEVLYHYRYQEGHMDLKKECWELKQENAQLNSILRNAVEKLECEINPIKSDIFYGVHIAVNGKTYQKIKRILKW